MTALGSILWFLIGFGAGLVIATGIYISRLMSITRRYANLLVAYRLLRKKEGQNDKDSGK